MGASAAAGIARARAEPARFLGLEWLNAPAQSLTTLHGKVAIVDSWTCSRINCSRTLPTLARWHAQYAGAGLAIIGIHTPEFGFERNPVNVRAAIDRFAIPWPVAMDNDALTWRAFDNEAWPGLHLFDRSGQLVLRRFGAAGYDQIETRFRELLPVPQPPLPRAAADQRSITTPELYLGLTRQTAPASPEPARRDAQRYTEPPGLGADRFALEGVWRLDPEAAVLEVGPGAITPRYRAARVHFVAAAPHGTRLALTRDGRAIDSVTIDEPRLYTLPDLPPAEHTLRIAAISPGLTAYAFTFG